MTQEQLLARMEEHWNSSSYPRREDLLVRSGVTRSSARFMVQTRWPSIPTIIKANLVNLEANLVLAGDQWDETDLPARVVILTGIGRTLVEAEFLATNRWSKLPYNTQQQIEELLSNARVRVEASA